jgi:phosphoglycerate dehydrogenase-like enzyme
VHLLYCGSGWRDVVDVLRAALGDGHTIAVWDRARPLAACVADVDVLLPSNAVVDAAVIAAAGRLRLIQQPAAGHEGIDLAAAAARGIPVCNAPGTNHVAVAECALLLMLALARRWRAAGAAFARGAIGEPVGVELEGRTLGLVGRGRTGDALARRAAALGMEVVALTSRSTEAERRAFWPRCDVVSLHCPVTPATRGLLGRAELAALPPGALVINVARGAVIDRAALGEALAGGRLGGVGLDVYWEEPWDPADPLFADPRVVTLPHVAGSTAEAFGRIAALVADNVARLGAGAPLRHRLA